MYGRNKTILSSGLLALALGLAGATLAGSADVDCTMCHDSAPIPDAHPPVDEVTVKACGMCHESGEGDPYFRAIHKHHADALGCDTCHADISDKKAARLKQLMKE